MTERGGGGGCFRLFCVVLRQSVPCIRCTRDHIFCMSHKTLLESLSWCLGRVLEDGSQPRSWGHFLKNHCAHSYGHIWPFFFNFVWINQGLSSLGPFFQSCWSVRTFSFSSLHLCKYGMVSPKYTIHRSNIKPIPCWAEIFALYGNTKYSLICTCSPRRRYMSQEMCIDIILIPTT